MRPLFLTFFLVTAFHPVLQAQKVSPDLASGRAAQSVDGKVNVIVQFKGPPATAEHQLVLGRGGVYYRDLSFVSAGAYSMPASAVQSLAAEPSVLHISEDHPVHSLLDLTAAAVNASAAWNEGLNGSGIGIAVIDSGISQVDDLTLTQNHFFFFPLPPSFNNRVVYRQNFLNTVQTDDYYGHGEHVSGILAGSGFDSQCPSCYRTFKGIASGASLIDLRVLDSNGNGSESYVIAAIQQAIALKNIFNIRVINLSLGHPVYESYQVDPLCQAVEAAWKAGIVVVVAAGNDGRLNVVGNNGYGTINSPGNDPYVITVGAMKTMGTPTRTDDLIASYSSKGPTVIDHILKPDLVAPGNRVVSLASPYGSLESSNPGNLVPTNYYSYQWFGNNSFSTHYFTLSGTSMATPVVAGAAAVLLQAHPGLSPDQVKAKLMKTAYKTFPQYSIAYDPTVNESFIDYYDVFTVGSGYLDIAAALADQTTFSGWALSPAVALPGTSGGSSSSASLLCSSATVCSNQNVAGNQTVWGSQSIWGNQTIWGSQSIWGSQTIWGSQSIWGSATTQAPFTTFAQSTTAAAEIVVRGEN